MGISSKIGGKGGHLVFFAREVGPFFSHVLADSEVKKFPIPKTLFLVNQYYPIPY
jgi:hypothetical protein